MTAALAVLLAMLGTAIPGLHTTINTAVPTPIGVGPRYTLAPAAAPACVAGRPATSAAHVELFARGRAMLIPPRVGMGAGCTSDVWTTEPTGVVHSSGAVPTLGQLFAAWGQPLGAHRLAGFVSRAPVRVYVDGFRVYEPVSCVKLWPHSEVVVELGSFIPPHRFYTFPEGT